MVHGRALVRLANVQPSAAEAVPVARRTKPWCTSRYEKREFPQWKLDGRGDRGAKMAAFVSAGVCIKQIGQ